MYPVWETKEAKPPKPAVYFIAHNRFGYLPHLNTLYLQVTRAGLRNLQRTSLANRRAFDEMIERLKISEHPQFLRRLSEIEQWPRQNFTSPPPEPPSLSPLASLPSYSCAKITNAFVVLNQKQPEPDHDSEPGAMVNAEPEPEPEPLDRNSSLKDIKNRYRRLVLLYHPDKCDAYLPLAKAVNGAYEICSALVNAIEKGEIWRDGNQRAAAPPPLALCDLPDGAASPALADGAGGGGDAPVLSVKRKRNPIEKKQTNVRHYWSNPLHMCTHNRNKKTYKAGNGGFRPRYEVTEAGVAPFKTDTAPRLVCKECFKAGHKDMLLTRNALSEPGSL